VVIDFYFRKKIHGSSRAGVFLRSLASTSAYKEGIVCLHFHHKEDFEPTSSPKPSRQMRILLHTKSTWQT